MEDKEVKAASELARFAAKVALAGVAVNYICGPIVVIAFLAGWLWGLPKEDTQ